MSGTSVMRSTAGAGAGVGVGVAMSFAVALGGEAGVDEGVGASSAEPAVGVPAPAIAAAGSDEAAAGGIRSAAKEGAEGVLPKRSQAPQTPKMTKAARPSQAQECEVLTVKVVAAASGVGDSVVKGGFWSCLVGSPTTAVSVGCNGSFGSKNGSARDAGPTGAAAVSAAVQIESGFVAGMLAREALCCSLGLLLHSSTQRQHRPGR